MKYHTNKEKQLDMQEFQMKMHSNLNDTYKVTRKQNGKFIRMYRNNLRKSSTLGSNQKGMGIYRVNSGINEIQDGVRMF